MKKNSILVSIDVGTSKTTALVGDFDEVGELNIVGLGISETEGIEKGTIINPNSVVKSIKKALKDAEKVSGVGINSAVVNLSGPNLEYQNISESLTFGTNQKEIDEVDIALLIEKVEEKINKDQYKIIHIIPKRYILDDENEVLDPKGFIASKIVGEFHVILIKNNSYINFKRVIEASGIKVLDFVVNPVASAMATLYQEEKDMGVLLLDIGGGTTDIAVLKDSSFEFVGSIPIGGNRITLDIAHRFRIPKEEAEELKLEYGLATVDALIEDMEIEINQIGSEDTAIISQYELVDTIEARLEEIFTLVKKEIEAVGFLDKINGGVVITGGVANTPYIKELAYRVFNTDVRIGKPKDYRGFSDRLNSPEFSTSIGILLFKRNYFNFKTNSTSLEKESDILNIFKTLIEKIKSLF